jgi:hypothetical protein
VQACGGVLLRAPELDTCAAGAVLGLVRSYGPNLFILWKVTAAPRKGG